MTTQNILYKSPVGSKGNISERLPSDMQHLQSVITQSYFKELSKKIDKVSNIEDVIYFVTNTFYNEYFELTTQEVNYPIVEDAVIGLVQDEPQVVADEPEVQDEPQVIADEPQVVTDNTHVKRYVIIGKINKNMLVENANVEINNEYDENEIKSILKNIANLPSLIENKKIQEKILEVK